MKWVLLLIVFGASGNSIVTTQIEFTSSETCSKAVGIILSDLAPELSLEARLAKFKAAHGGMTDQEAQKLMPTVPGQTRAYCFQR